MWNYAVLDAIEFLAKNPNVKGHIFFFSLELIALELHIKVFSSLMYRKFKKEYDRSIFMGHHDQRLTEEELKFLVEDCAPYRKVIDENVTIFDEDATPVEIVERFSERLNEMEDLDYKIVVIDTVNAIGIQPGMSKQESMKYWNQEVALKVLRKEMKCIVINIMQLDMESGKRQFDNNANSIVEKYIPTLESIGNDKEAPRSASLVLSLFDPQSFNIKNLFGYDIESFQGTIRFLFVLKSNFGKKNQAYPFVYHGAVNRWIEVIHSPEEFRTDSSLYLKYGLNPVVKKNVLKIKDKYRDVTESE